MMILLSTETPFNPANFKGKSDTETSISVDNHEDGHGPSVVFNLTCVSLYDCSLP